MAKFIENMLNFMKLDEERDEYDDFDLDEEEYVVPQEEKVSNATTTTIKKQSKVVNIHSTNQMKLIVVTPEKYDDAQEICDQLKNKKPVVINLENMDPGMARRVIDFLGGATYAVDGTIQRIANNIFIVAPPNVDITGNLRDELKSKGVIMPWMK